MVKTFVGLSLMVAVLGFSAVAQAEEQLMVLWPNQRATHQVNIEEQGAAYKARGEAYVDHLYATGGETSLAPETGSMFSSDVQPVPIDITDVVNMIDQGETATSETAPDTSADVSLQ